jgi:hypothetical protein
MPADDSTHTSADSAAIYRMLMPTANRCLEGCGGRRLRAFPGKTSTWFTSASSCGTIWWTSWHHVAMDSASGRHAAGCRHVRRHIQRVHRENPGGGGRQLGSCLQARLSEECAKVIAPQMSAWLESLAIVRHRRAAQDYADASLSDWPARLYVLLTDVQRRVARAGRTIAAAGVDAAIA